MVQEQYAALPSPRKQARQGLQQREVAMGLQESHPRTSAQGNVQHTVSTKSKISVANRYESAGASMYRPTRRERLRHYFSMHPKAAMRFELINAALSALACILYVVDVYTSEEFSAELWFWCINLVLNLYFLFDYTLSCLRAPSARSYATSFLGVLDALTVFPPLFLTIFTWLFDRHELGKLLILRVLRIFVALRIFRLQRLLHLKATGREQASKEIMTRLFLLFALVFCVTGVFHAVELQWYLDQGDHFYFHDSLYFMLVTVGTVGYGDFTPKTIAGRIIVMGVVIAIITFIPEQLARLVSLAQQRTPWDKPYVIPRKGKGHHGHVIVCGSLKDEAVKDFMHEFRSPSRGVNKMHVVLLSPDPPSSVLTNMIVQEEELFFVLGSPTVERDLLRCGAATSDGVFILANRYSASPEDEDSLTTIRMLSVSSFLESRKAHVPIFVQFLEAQDRPSLLSVIGRNQPVFMSKLKYCILAQGTSCPGAVALITNLIRSHDLEDYQMIKELSPWLSEYVHGLGREIYPILLTAAFDGKTFAAVAEWIFGRFGAILLAALVEEQPSKPSRVKLAPMDLELEEGLLCFVIASDGLTAHTIVQEYTREEEERAKIFLHQPDVTEAESAEPASYRSNLSFSGRMRRPEWLLVHKDSLINRNNNASVAHLEEVLLNMYEHEVDQATARSKSQVAEREGESSVPLSTLFAPLRSTNNSPHSSRSSFSQRIDAAPAPSPAAQAASAHHHDVGGILSTSSRPVEVYEASTHDGRGALDDLPTVSASLPSSSELLSSLQAQSLDSTVGLMENHIVVCGATSHLHQFVDVLRRYYSLMQEGADRPPIVLLNASPPSLLQWSQMGCPRDVFYIQGNALQFQDLLRAGVPHAVSTIVMAKLESHSPSPSPASSLRRGDDVVLEDYTTLMSLLCVEDVQVKVEDARRRSTRRQSTEEEKKKKDTVKGESAKQGDDERGSGARQKVEENGPVRKKSSTPVADHQYRSVIVELKNPSNIRYCRPRDPTLHLSDDSLFYLAPAFAAGRVYVSILLDSLLCQALFNPFIVDIITLLAGGRLENDLDLYKQRDLDGERKAMLVKLPVPIAFVGDSFLSLFRQLLRQGSLAIAVYRSPKLAGSPAPYVYTCPPPDAILHRDDQVFVLTLPQSEKLR